MGTQHHFCYEDDKLSSMEIAALIDAQWQTGKYSTIAEVTTAVHHIRHDLPRSVIFWLAFHTLDTVTAPPASITAGTWPPL
jgi:hypothetical protein